MDSGSGLSVGDDAPMNRGKGNQRMIELTRLNGSVLAVNCDIIRYAEAAPDTLLTLITGEKLVVREACDVVARKVLAYRAQVLREAWPDAVGALSARMAWDVNNIVRTADVDEE